MPSRRAMLGTRCPSQSEETTSRSRRESLSRVAAAGLTPGSAHAPAVRVR